MGRTDASDPSASAAQRHPIISLSGIEYSYPDGTHVLDKLTLPVAAGATVGIVGPSGCGKSTLLSLMAGLRSPTGGEMIRNFSADRHPVSMVFQKDTLLPWLTAAENVRVFARFRSHHLKRGRLRRALRTPKSPRERELEERVEELLELGHLADSADKYPYQLSGGMRRRLAFLAAVAPRPQLLLLDEPFSSVDEPTRIGIHQDVFRIVRQLGITTVIVTHDLAEAISMCDEVFILSARPTSCVAKHDVPFGEDRRMLDLRGTKEYLDLYGQVWHDLSAQIKRSGVGVEPEEAA